MFLCCETFRYWQRYPARGSFSNAWDSPFQAANVSNMSIAVMHSRQFCDVQHLLFETAKIFDMGCATVLEVRFVDASKSSFQGAKNSYMDSNYVE